jgi:hypothetical protein
MRAALFSLLAGCGGAVEAPAPAPASTPAPSPQATAKPAAPAPAKPVTDIDDGDATICTASAYVIDPDPAGLNVRAQPGKSGSVVGAMPADAMVDVQGRSDGWLQVRLIATPDNDTPAPLRGWVYAKMLGVDFAGEFEASGVDLRASADDSADVSGHITTSPRLLDCGGGWLRVEGVQGPDQGKVGWMAPGTWCGSSLTSCS